MTDYRVGQVLYIIPDSTASVVPMLVMERRISETIDGTAVKHIVKSPKPKAQPIILETIKGRIFADLRVARETMVKNATSAIDAMVKHAHNVAQQAFAPKQSLPPPQMKNDVDPFDTSDVLTDDVDNEIIPRDEMRTPQHSQSFTQIDVDADESGMTEVMLPNGEKKLVRLKTS